MAFRNRLFSLHLLVSTAGARGCIGVSCKPSRFEPGRGERIQQRRVFLARQETKGLGSALREKRRDESSLPTGAFFPQSSEFRGGRGSIKCLGKRGWESRGNTAFSQCELSWLEHDDQPKNYQSHVCMIIKFLISLLGSEIMLYLPQIFVKPSVKFSIIYTDLTSSIQQEDKTIKFV